MTRWPDQGNQTLVGVLPKIRGKPRGFLGLVVQRVHRPQPNKSERSMVGSEQRHTVAAAVGYSVKYLGTCSGALRPDRHAASALVSRLLRHRKWKRRCTRMARWCGLRFGPEPKPIWPELAFIPSYPRSSAFPLSWSRAAHTRKGSSGCLSSFVAACGDLWGKEQNPSSASFTEKANSASQGA